VELLPAASSPSPGARLSPEERRWLHDKYERLAAEEGQLAASRTSYYAAIASVLVTGMVVATAYFRTDPLVLAGVVSFLAALGVVISFVWVVLLHRTNDAQTLWREAAARLEELAPPLEGELPGTVRLRSRRTLTVNLLRPYGTHRTRFSPGEDIGWMDRIPPGRFTEFLPLAFLVLWLAVLAYAWTLYFLS
jgi:hypothetical protein